MRILVLGGTGSLGSYVIEALLKDENASLRLYGRKPAKLEKYKSNHVEIIKGDVLDEAALKEALKGVDGVYAGLAGSLESMANTLVKVMSETGIKRLVWITSYGIYDGEVPSGRSAPSSYANSAVIIESSSLNYTLIRPQWFSGADEINYEITSWNKKEKFKNKDAQISRKSIADLVRRCFYENLGQRDSLGINRPASR